MFTPRSSGRPRVSPYVGTSGSRQLKSAGRRSLNLFTPKRTSLTPGLTSQFSSGNRLQSSQIIDETSHYVIEVFGAPLPVLVMEAFILTERGTEVSVKLDESGWAWLVCGRRLFIWRYKIIAGLNLAATQCRELTLPPSDLAHKADLVCILINNESSVPGAIAVSPEGIIRYWPVIAHEGLSVEVSAELHGQECESLINIQPFGCILSTTTSTLVLVSPATAGGQSTVTCSALKSSQSVLVGIGRRMSSFIFGSLPSQSTEMKLHSILATDGNKRETKILYVLTGNNLQKWQLSLQEADKLELEFDVDKLLRDNLVDKIWNKDHSLVSHVKTWLLDMKLARNGVIILGAGMNLQSSQQVHLVFGMLNLDESNPPINFSSFTIFDYQIWYQEENEEQLLNYHFLLPDFNQNIAYIYKERKILCVPVTDCYQEVQEVVLNSQGDKILGAGCCNQKALFFSNNSGIISVKYLIGTSSLEDTIPTEPVSILEEVAANVSQAKIDELSSSENSISRFKGAFLHYCKNNLSQAQSVIGDLFPTSSSNETGFFLDKLVADVGQQLIDDHPASDPRWAESVQQDTIMASHSLILLHQLEDKMKAHDYYITFLKSVGLWDQLTNIVVHDHLMSTRLLLCEHAEKITAAISLRELQNKNSKPVDIAIQIVLKTRGEVILASGLSHQDLFYREISRIQEILPALMDYEQESISTAVSSMDLLTLVTTVNSIMEGMLHGACYYRQTNASMYQSNQAVKEPEYLPWTASLGSSGLRTLLLKQHKVCVEQAIPEADDVQTRGLLFQQLLGLIDLILDGYKCQLESIRIKDGETPHFLEILRKYEQERHNLILPLLHHEQYSRAASLAEKYCDFGILVQLCEKTDNKQRLQQYRVQFADQGFSDFVFQWYLNTGKRSKLMSDSFGEPEELGRFLESHDTLSWLHDVHTHNYNKAQMTLQNLAISEQEFMARKKTMLSLSKLTALASDELQETIQAKTDFIDDQLMLLSYQESLPIKVLENTGLDAQTMRVLDPRELIELYIGEDNEQANEYDFKKALDLINFINKNNPNVDIEALKQHIWCRAILRDSWDDAETDNPLLSKRETIFFKTVELAFLHGTNLWDILPDVNCLLQCDELGALRENRSFKFLVKAGYEHLHRII